MFFIGNCQAEAIYGNMVRSKQKSRLAILTSFQMHRDLGIRHVKRRIDEYVNAQDLKQMLYEGVLVPQPSMTDLTLEYSDVLVLSLFHERPLYRHIEEGFFLSCAIDMLQRYHPDLFAWIEDEFEQIGHRVSYFDDLLVFLGALREKRPDIPIVIIKRLSHFSSLGQCHCSNAWWTEHWQDWPELEAVIQKRYRDIHFVDLDRIVAGLLHSISIEELIPNAFLKKQGDKYTAVRDTEHFGVAVWCRVAELVDLFLKNKRIQYNQQEKSDYDWSRNHCIAEASDETIHLWLGSGELMLQRKALNLMLIQRHEAPAEVLLQHVDNLQFHFRFFSTLTSVIEGGRLAGCNELLLALQNRNCQLHSEGSYNRDLFTDLFDELTLLLANPENIPRFSLIGEGMQCRVYKWGSEKVLKQLRDLEQSRSYYKRRYPEFSQEGNDYSTASALCYTSAARFAVELVRKRMIDGPMLANPQAVGKTAMIQDEVVPCKTAFLNGEKELDNGVLEKFVAINAALWFQGVFEVTMSLENYGFRGDDLVLFDFFEIGTNKDDWRMLEELRWWRQCNRYFTRFREDLLEKLDEYFGQMYKAVALQPAAEEAPDGCRLSALRNYVEQIRKSEAGLPWLN